VIPATERAYIPARQPHPCPEYIGPGKIARKREVTEGIQKPAFHQPARWLSCRESRPS